MTETATRRAGAGTPEEMPATARRDGGRVFVRQMIESHSILGLGLAALIYVVSLTGALTVFIDEIKLWENPHLPAAAAVPDTTLVAALAEVTTRVEPGHRITTVIATAPTAFLPVATARLNEQPVEGGPLRSRDWVVDPATGRLGDLVETPFAHVVEHLHTDLLLPRPWGRYLVGLIGVAMVTLILSGILAHPSIFKDAFKLRLGQSDRIAWTDLHNRLSVWGLPFHLVVTFTGAFLGLAGLIILVMAMIVYDGDQERAVEAVLGPQPIAGEVLTAPPPYADMLARAARYGRPLRLVSEQPWSTGGVSFVDVQPPDMISSGIRVSFRNTGEHLRTIGGPGDQPGVRVLAALGPLHYGTFGGYGIKAAYFLLALALTHITTSGMVIWFRRRAQQGAPVPTMEAAWRGMTAGLGLGLSVMTMAAAIGLRSEGALIALLLAPWAVAFLRIRWAGRPLVWVRRVWWACAALLLAAALIHLPLALGASAVAVPRLVALDLLLVLLAAGFAVAAWRHRGHDKETGKNDPGTAASLEGQATAR